MTTAAMSPAQRPFPAALSKTRRLSLTQLSSPLTATPFYAPHTVCGSVAPAFSSSPDLWRHLPRACPKTPSAVPICRGAGGALHTAVPRQEKSKRVPRGQQLCTPESQGDNPTVPCATLTRNQDPTPKATAVTGADRDGPALQAVLTTLD